MSYRRFTMEQKIRFLDLYEESGVAATAASMDSRKDCWSVLNFFFLRKVSVMKIN